VLYYVPVGQEGSYYVRVASDYYEDLGPYQVRIRFAQDCNNNGVADNLDIDSGTSQDCNANGTPDECDIIGADSQDCQPDGIPDDCQRAEQPPRWQVEGARPSKLGMGSAERLCEIGDFPQGSNEPGCWLSHRARLCLGAGANGRLLIFEKTVAYSAISQYLKEDTCWRLRGTPLPCRSGTVGCPGAHREIEREIVARPVAATGSLWR
jgi:hypothetical protein